MTSPTVSKAAHAKSWRYYLPNIRERREGWAIFFLDEIGSFTVLSDYGNYGYRWSEGGWWSKVEYDFRVFVLQTDDHYILGKISVPDSEYQDEKTLAAVKRAIIEARRCRAKSADWARTEWDLLRDCSDLYTAEDFARWSGSTQLDEYWDYASYGPSRQAVAFIENVMPRFRAMLRAELEAEGLVKTERSA